MRGRIPAPTALKILRGVRSDRINDREPAAPEGLPEPPEHLDKLARQEWGRMAEILSRMGVLSRADGSALALYCETYSKWLQARVEIQKRGLVIERDVINSKGAVTGTRVFQNPAVSIEFQAIKLMKSLLIEFGLTPSSRSRIRVEGETEKDDLGAFLAEG